MTPAHLAYCCCAAALASLIVYTLLGGADFGGGVWDLLATGPRKRAQRHAIAHAMGPVWEANHVWLIFVIVLLFTCFPAAFSVLCIALFVPLHLTLLGIILRGAAFIFRHHAAEAGGESHEPDAGSNQNQPVRTFRSGLTSPRGWGLIFGAASIISPVLLGTSFGVITSGRLRVQPLNLAPLPGDNAFVWLTPYSLSCGLLALSACAYLAAVYLVVETRGPLREDFRRRAIFAGTTTAFLAGVVLLLAAHEATWFARQLLSPAALPLLGVGLALFAASALAVFRRHYRMSCVCAAAEIAMLLVGWALAQRGYLIYPDLTVTAAAAPPATLRFILISLPIGLSILLPSLWLLFHVFKFEHVVKDQASIR